MARTRSHFRRLTAASAASAGLLLNLPAHADETGFYVGANAGRVLSTYHRTDLNNAEIADFGANGNYTFGTSSIEKSRVMWSVDVGYLFSPNWGVEAWYLDLGSLRYSSFGTQPSSDGTTNQLVTTEVHLRTHGPALAAVGVLPMSNIWSIDARLGAYQAKTVSSFTVTVDTQSNSGNPSKSSTAVLAGVGTALTLTTHCVARLDYMRLQHIDESAFDRSFNVDLVTVGVAYVF